VWQNEVVTPCILQLRDVSVHSLKLYSANNVQGTAYRLLVVTLKFPAPSATASYDLEYIRHASSPGIPPVVEMLIYDVEPGQLLTRFNPIDAYTAANSKFQFGATDWWKFRDAVGMVGHAGRLLYDVNVAAERVGEQLYSLRSLIG
jgi:hypothetical protein